MFAGNLFPLRGRFPRGAALPVNYCQPIASRGRSRSEAEESRTVRVRFEFLFAPHRTTAVPENVRSWSAMDRWKSQRIGECSCISGYNLTGQHKSCYADWETGGTTAHQQHEKWAAVAAG